MAEMNGKPLAQIAFLADYGKLYGKGLEISSILEASAKTDYYVQAFCRDRVVEHGGSVRLSEKKFVFGSYPYRSLSLLGKRVAPTFKARLWQERMFDTLVSRNVLSDVPLFFGVPRLTKSFKQAKRAGLTTVLHGAELAPGYMRSVIASLYGSDNFETNILGGGYLSSSEDTLEFVDYVFCHSEFSKQTYIEQGIPESRIRVFPMGGNFVSQEHENTYLSSRSNRFGASSIAVGVAPIRFLYVGNVTRVKGIHLLVEAMRQLNNENVELHICGDMDSDFERQFGRLARENKKIIFHGNVDPRNFYMSVDFFVFPTLIDSFGRVVVEAGSYGVPCISTEVGKACLVEDGVTGIIVEPTRESVVAGLRRAIDSTQAVGRWSQKIKERASQLSMAKFGECNVNALIELANR